MKAIWAREESAPGGGEIGPKVDGGPSILIGALTEPALRRVGRLGDGFLAAPDPAEEVARKFEIVREAWAEAGRPGSPRLVGGLYYALGNIERGRAYMRSYYAFTDDKAELWAESMIANPQGIRDAIRDFAAIGMDELLFHPCDPDLSEVDRLADVVS